MYNTIKKYCNCIIFIWMTLCLCACTARSSSVVTESPFFTNHSGDETTGIQSSDTNSVDSMLVQGELEAIAGEAELVATGAVTIPLRYAEGFSLEQVEGDYYIISIGEQKIITIPEGEEPLPWMLEENNVILIRQPLENVYVAATSIPDLIACLGRLDQVSYTSTTYEDWALPAMREALEELSIEYVGKYRAPDYEVLLANGCNLAIESTMIYHNPEVYEKLNTLGIPVMVDASSYEKEPLGRLEWIKVYGALFGCFQEATAIFDEKVDLVENLDLSKQKEVKKKVAFFYINTNGSVVVRKPGDYITKMIDLAGGEYVITSIPEEDNALSTMNMQMEAFYAEAIDADVLIYNSTIDGEVTTLEELFAKSDLLRDFKAVQTGNVWCSGKNMFQESSAVAEMITDLYKVLHEEEDNQYFHRIKR